MITRESDYAIRCVMHLAALNGQLSNVDDISKAQKIPKAFAAKILQKLVKAGIAQSKKGVKGGFAILKDPLHITILEVVETLQGTIEINTCVIDGIKCERSSFCSIHPIWVEIQKDLVKKLNSYNFKMLTNK